MIAHRPVCEKFKGNTGETAPSLKSGKPTKLYRCDAFGTCTLTDRAKDVKGCCDGCGKYENKHAAKTAEVLNRNVVPLELTCVHRSDEPLKRDDGLTETAECPTCPGQIGRANTKPVYGCEVHGKCTKEIRVPSVKGCCVGCKEKQTNEISVNQGAGGLGDALMGACAINGLRKLHKDRPVVYKVHPSVIPFVKLFDLGQTILGNHDWDDGNERPKGDPHPNDMQMNTGYRYELQTHGKFTRLQRNCRNIGGVTPELPSLKARDFLLTQGRDFQGAIALSPFSTWTVREWPINHWKMLERLLREEGYRVVVLASNQKQIDPEGKKFPAKDLSGRERNLTSEIVLGAPAQRVAGILLNSACLVGNDSGLAHLNGIMDKPTLVLCGQTTGKEIYGFYGQQMNYLEGHLDCRGCWWQTPFNATCEPTCPNIATITPKEVAQKIVEMVGPPQPRPAYPTPQGETSKAHARRLREGWFAEHIKAPCLDVGCWIDYLLPGFPCRRWDQMYGDGDATKLDGVADSSFATVFASHVLEHIDDPVTALRNWWRVLRPGGRLVVCVPSKSLYEKKDAPPSRYNGDHKTFWNLETGGPESTTLGLKETVLRAIPQTEIVSLRTLDEGFESEGPEVHSRGEFSYEIIVRKLA